jgi:hypothetical protein
MMEHKIASFPIRIPDDTPGGVSKTTASYGYGTLGFLYNQETRVLSRFTNILFFCCSCNGSKDSKY